MLFCQSSSSNRLPYEISVFVWCDSIANGQLVAISNKHILTCYHNLLENSQGNPEQNYSIALSVERLKANPINFY
jgi:hypothetical protein